MPRYPEYSRSRIAQLAELLRGRIYPELVPLASLEVSGPVGRIGFAEAERLAYRQAALGEQLGPLWSTFWFRGRAQVPEAWDGRRVDLLWVSHSEAALWRHGRILQGLNYEPGTDGRGPARPDALLTGRARGGETLGFFVEVACNGLFGAPFEHQRGQRPRSISPFVLDRCEVGLFDEEAWALHHDLVVLKDLEAAEDLDRSWAGYLLAELNQLASTCDPDDRRTWPAARARLQALYARGRASDQGGRPHQLSAIGHAHIDTAWLWTTAETVRKCERSLASQLGYLERYPEHRFACSSAQHFAWIRARNPELYARVKAAVASGGIVPVGGSWVEPDTNLPSGESLVRQLLHGQRFFERELGHRCRELWLPDVFGYSGQLPQLMRLAGMSRFLTQKLSWNRFNQPPHHTFTWQGIDGSEVLAHFPPADTYNATCEVAELRRNVRDYRDHVSGGESLLVFGHGDGGGGPTPRMLELLRRARDLLGLPRTEIRPVDAFFDRLEADARELPTVVGELYFELHRGTYTTQARTKQANRRGEELLHDAELLAAWASRVAALPYPRAELEEAWQLLLTAQFHDVLPGSSIAEVYQEAARDHARVQAMATRIRDRALQALSGTRPGATAQLAVNTLAHERGEVVDLVGSGLAFARVPGLAWATVDPAGASPSGVSCLERPDEVVMENQHLLARLSRGGALLSLVEKGTGREALCAPGNVLELYQDQPTTTEAWDIDPFHLETRTECPPAEACSVEARGPLRAAVRFERRIGGHSRLRQEVRLDAGARRLELHTEVDWQESQRLLKVAFPVRVRAMNATYEVQLGCLERPTHFNTSHDLARFEVPAHRFSDLGEHGFGVALLSDSRHGFSTLGSTLRLTLLRAPLWPDPACDRGQHRFAYAIMPHAGGWQRAGVVAEAQAFSMPLRVLAVDGAEAPTRRPPLATRLDGELVLDTVKLAEDSSALVLRFYEPHGGRGRARLRLGVPFARARRVNLLEEPLEDAPAPEVDGDEVAFAYRPYEVITLLID